MSIFETGPLKDREAVAKRFGTGPLNEILDAEEVQEVRQTTLSDIILSIRDISVAYQTRQGMLSAVDKLSLDVYKGEILGLVGESGCGKSTLGRAIMRLIRPPGQITHGQIMYRGENLVDMPEETMRQIRGKYISTIFQDPMSSLNPVQRIDEHMIEAIKTHEPNISQAEARDRAVALMERLGIGAKRLNDHPHQLSGGMRQRVMIALALALKAQIIIADEATTSLDVIVQAQFLALLRELTEEFGLTIIMITHNIGVIAQVADRVAVMYAGRLAEIGTVDAIFHEPKHPYTQGLLQSVPNIDLDDQALYRMEGVPPDLINPPKGCRFHPRCPHVVDVCRERQPWLASPDDVLHRNWVAHRYDKNLVACWLHHEGAIENRE